MNRRLDGLKTCLELSGDERTQIFLPAPCLARSVVNVESALNGSPASSFMLMTEKDVCFSSSSGEQILGTSTKRNMRETLKLSIYFTYTSLSLIFCHKECQSASLGTVNVISKLTFKHLSQSY